MGLLRNLWGGMTGNWATLRLSVPPLIDRGIEIPIEVEIEVRDSDLQVSSVYLRWRLVERGEVSCSGKDCSGGTESSTVREERVILHHAGDFSARSRSVASGMLLIPDSLPSSFRGRICQVNYEALAALEMSGNDPDSGWKPLQVR
ncbi:hypothetical protein LBMAG53_31830 [Planctomycetota bacterium]|nr:hypothetical protein LBMAG53_31830 [Planctomycetota bacterium]